MSLLDVVVSGVVSALVTSGLLIAVFKKAIFNYLDLRKEKALKELEYKSEKRESILDSRLIAYPEILEICYRAKVVAEEFIKEGDLPSKEVEEFGELVSHLTEKLFKYRLYVPEEIWPVLHETKHVCQNLLVWLDILTRVNTERQESVIEKSMIAAKKAAEELTEKTSELEELLRKSIDKITKL